MKPVTAADTTTVGLKINFDDVVSGKYTCGVLVSGVKITELVRTVTKSGILDYSKSLFIINIY